MHPIFANIFATQSAAAVATSNAMNKSELEQYEALLRSHDWEYQYSDDYQAYKRGAAQRATLNALADKLDPDRVIWKNFGKVSI
jgi:hypothetical protein